MAGNSLLTDSIIVKESLMELKNQLGFTKNINRQYDDRFAVEGAKIGDTINVRKPSRYEVTTGATYVGQDSADQSVALQLDTQCHVGLAFSSKDMTLSVDAFNERYVKPAVTALANKVDYTGLALYKKVQSAVGVPSATAFPSTLKGFLQAKQKLAENGAPKGMYNAIVSPSTEASLVNGLSGLFQSSDKIAAQYEDGTMGIAAGSKFMMSQNVASHTIGALGGTPLVSGATVSGATTLVTKGWTAAAAPRLKEGDVFTIAGVNAVNPQTRQSTGSLQNFVVTADFSSDGSGNGTVSIYPAIITSGQYQTVDALPVDGAAILVFGSASAYAGIVCPQNLVYHKDFAVLGCADLFVPKGVHMGARASDPESGLSVRLIAQYDGVNDRMLSRLDILFGWKVVYPELACRVVGQPA
jgi:hypothetical protein